MKRHHNSELDTASTSKQLLRKPSDEEGGLQPQPKRQATLKVIPEMYQRVRAKVLELLKDLPHIVITTDIWTRYIYTLGLDTTGIEAFARTTSCSASLSTRITCKAELTTEEWIMMEKVVNILRYQTRCAIRLLRFNQRVHQVITFPDVHVSADEDMPSSSRTFRVSSPTKAILKVEVVMMIQNFRMTMMPNICHFRQDSAEFIK
ncbi:hypothetical protein EVAR_85321_1 [Eumeta japonica]|uniref:Zinc finger BED domain-containing protein 4 n=1 Tax=Eumeta variegata TaxID=151549 RepID=A0A4C1ZYI4_EUMVA|nr:hypothetical protein EVAR_85321_1 [Eumeta japonica]